MIEMVYRGTSKNGKAKERCSLPKNIRQIGDAGQDKRVYIEDYAATFLEGTGYALLVGEIWQNGSMKCLFVDGAVRVEAEEFGDSMWEKVYREMKQYFPDREVLGWAKKTEDPEEELSEQDADLHRDQFPGEDRLLFLHDGEGNGSVYLSESTGIKKQQGYCIYYEKNEQMQNYMVKENEGKSVEAEEGVPDNAIKNFRKRLAEKRENAQKEEKEQYNGRTPLMVRFLYGASMFLVLTILVIGVTMVNNYNRMKDMEMTLSEMALGEDNGAAQETEKSGQKAALSDNAAAEGEKALTANAGADGSVASSRNTGVSQLQTESSRLEETDGQGTAEGTLKEAGQTEGGFAETGGQNTEDQDGTSGTADTEAENMGTESTESQNRAASSANVVSRQAEYTVREGDTLATVCRMYYGNLDKLQEICDVNGILDPNTILPGQKLVLP